MADRRRYLENGAGEDDGEAVSIAELAEHINASLEFAVEALKRIKVLSARVTQLETELADQRAAARSRLWLPPT